MFIALPVLAFWFTAHAVLSRFVGTCTMGDTDRFVAGLILGVPAAAIAVPVLFRAPPRTGWRMAAVLTTALLAVVVLFLWVPLAISAGLQGHHLCGPEFDGYLVATGGCERLIPLAQVAGGLGLLIGGFRNVWRAVGAARPGVEPDGHLRGRGLTP